VALGEPVEVAGDDTVLRAPLQGGPRRGGRGADLFVLVHDVSGLGLSTMVVVQYQKYDDRRTKGMDAMTTTHATQPEIELGAVLHALSDPVRLRIVAGLVEGDERSCGSFDLPVAKSTCTHHFRVLREARIIDQRQAGTARLNTLRRDELEARFPGLLDTILRAAAGT
jgi:DNA-binding transcriptional ArsR family regulator